MSDLGRSGREFVEATRSLDEPTEADRRRIHAATLARIAATAAGAAAATKATAALASTPAAAGGGWLSGAMVGALFGLAVVGAETAVEVATGWGPFRRQASITAPVPPPRSAAPTVAAPVPTVLSSSLPAPPASTPAPARPAAALVPAEEAGADQPAAPPRASLDEEIAVLRRAQEALRDGKADEAAALLDHFEAQRPGGALSEERHAARLVAACKSGRGAEVRAGVEAFLRDHPESPLAASVSRACTEK